jgi:aryl-alcohol dehydrogenase-like predicted oxidoreductase
MKRRKFIGTVSAVTLAGISGLQNVSCNLGSEGNRSGIKSIPRRELGRTGVKVSILTLGGVAAMAEVPTRDFHPGEMADAALNAGINYFDTAAAYGNGQSERNYGKVLATRRKEVFLASKTGERTYDGVMRQVEESLDRLQTDHLDLYQVHGVRDNEDFGKWDSGLLKAFHKLRDDKVTRFIGVTGHESAGSVCRAIELYDFDTVLTTFNPVARRQPFEEKVIPLAREKNMGVLAMKIMGGGYGSLARGNPIKNNQARWYYDQAPRQTEASTLIRFALGLPISSAVIGMGSLEQLQYNVAAVINMPPLNEKERKELTMFMS